MLAIARLLSGQFQNFMDGLNGKDTGIFSRFNRSSLIAATSSPSQNIAAPVSRDNVKDRTVFAIYFVR